MSEAIRATQAQPLTDAQIAEIRDEHLPSQGEPFDCIAFARAVLRASQSAASVDDWKAAAKYVTDCHAAEVESGFRRPVATVVNNNQPHWTAIIETAPNVTLNVGTKLYLAPQEGEVEECARQCEAAGHDERLADGGLYLRAARLLRATQSNDPGGWQERERVLYGESPTQSTPAQEPVAWRVKVAQGQWRLVFDRQQGERLLTSHGNSPDTIEPLYAAPQPDEARKLLARLVAAVPEPELVYSLDEPPAHRTMEEHELGYALHLAREYLKDHP